MDTAIKLYFAPRTRATRPRWLLEELGVPYELVQLDLSKAEHKQLAYLRIHPLGLVPALVDGDVTIIESAAICMYLADKYQEKKKLAPALNTPERAQYYQWMVFAGATLEPPIAEYAELSSGPEDKRNPEAAAKAKEKALAVIKAVEHALLGKMYLVGEKFSAADVVMGAVLRWAESLKLLTDAPDIQSWLYELKSHEAFKKATAA